MSLFETWLLEDVLLGVVAGWSESAINISKIRARSIAPVNYVL